MREFIMHYLDPVGIVIGLIATIPIFWTWWEVSLGRKRRHKKWLEGAKSGKSPDAVLIVDLLANDDMKPDVVKYLSQQGLGVAESNIFELNEHGEISPDKLPDLVDRFRKIMAEISRLAPGQLYLFYGGPAAFAMLVGAELANKGNIHVYQRTHGQYIDWGPVRHAHF